MDGASAGSVRSRRGVALATLAALLVADHAQELLRLLPGYRALYELYPFWIPEGLKSALQIAGVTAVAALLLRRGAGGALRAVGLAPPVGPGVRFGLLATLPLWIGFALTTPLAAAVPPGPTVYLALVSPLAEEVVYRGFAFGILRRWAGWGFWPAALVPAALFGWGHVDGGQGLGEAAGLMALTGGGAVFFSWFYQRWGWRIWAPLALHVLMNLAWQLFAVGETALAGWWPTALQLTTLAVAVVLTLLRGRLGWLAPRPGEGAGR